MKQIKCHYKLNVLIATFSLLMLFGSVIGFVHWKIFSDLLTSIIGFFFSGLIFIYPLYRVFFKNTVLVVDGEGISYNIFPGMAADFKWSEIKTIRFGRWGLRANMGIAMIIVPNDNTVFTPYFRNYIAQIFVKESLFELADEIKRFECFKGEIFGKQDFIDRNKAMHKAEGIFALKTLFYVLLLIGIFFGGAYLYLNR